MDTQRAGLSWKQWLLGIGVLTISLALAGAVILAMYKLFARLPSQVATAVTAIIAAGLGAAVTAILTKRSERRMEIERQIREEKIPIYESFLVFWFKLVPGKGMPQNMMPQEEIIAFLREFTQKMITWGSDDVLKVYCKMRKSLVEQASGSGQANYGAILLLEEMLGSTTGNRGWASSVAVWSFRGPHEHAGGTIRERDCRVLPRLAPRSARDGVNVHPNLRPILRPRFPVVLSDAVRDSSRLGS